MLRAARECIADSRSAEACILPPIIAAKTIAAKRLVCEVLASVSFTGNVMVAVREVPSPKTRSYTLFLRCNKLTHTQAAGHNGK